MSAIWFKEHAFWFALLGLLISGVLGWSAGRLELAQRITANEAKLEQLPPLQEKFDVLNPNLAELRATVKAVQERVQQISRVQGKLADLNLPVFVEDAKNNTRVLEETTSILSSLRTDVAGLNGRASSVETAVDELQITVASLSRSDVPARVGALEAAFTVLQKRIAELPNLTGKVGTLERETKTLKKAAELHMLEYSGLDQRASDLEALDITTKLETIDQTLKKHRESTNALIERSNRLAAHRQLVCVARFVALDPEKETILTAPEGTSASEWNVVIVPLAAGFAATLGPGFRNQLEAYVPGDDYQSGYLDRLKLYAQELSNNTGWRLTGMQGTSGLIELNRPVDVCCLLVAKRAGFGALQHPALDPLSP